MNTGAAASRFLVLTILAVVLVLSSAQTAFTDAPSVELFYDDGNPEQEIGGQVGARNAVMFSLPSGWSNAKLLTAKYYLSRDCSLAGFRVHVYASDGETDLLTETLVYYQSAAGWAFVDLSSYNIVVSGDFYVAIEWTTNGAPCLGIDYTSPHGRSYGFTSVGWEVRVYDSMIRAEVTELQTTLAVTFVPPAVDITTPPPLNTVTVTGTVTPHVAGKEVFLSYCKDSPAGPWMQLGQGATDAEGKFSVTWTPAEIGTYYFRANLTDPALTVTSDPASLLVVPEFPLWLTPTLLILSLATATVLARKTRHPQNTP